MKNWWDSESYMRFWVGVGPPKLAKKLQLAMKRQKLQTGAIAQLKCVDGLMATVLTSRQMPICLLYTLQHQ